MTRGITQENSSKPSDLARGARLRVAITGSGGYLAQQLITRLGSDSHCEFILGLDIRPRAPVEAGVPQIRCAAEFLRFDLTSPWQELAELLRQYAINSALHLAWQFNPIHDARRHRQVDVGGSENFFRAAQAARLERVVYTSSATAYVNPRNPAAPPFISEAAPVSGTPRYLYSKHKAEVDRLAQEFMARHPETQVMVLRPAIVLGPHTQNIVSKMAEWPAPGFPWVVQVRGADPPVQFLSEADAGEILYRAVTSNARGVFNCAGDGVMRFSEFVRQIGKKPLALPAFVIYPLAAILWFLRLAPFPPGLLDMIRYPWVADNSKLKTDFGYTPRDTSRQALDSFLASRRAKPRPLG